MKELNADTAADIWFDVADGIPGMLGRNALGCTGIDFEKPNIFVATFENAVAKDFCEKESARLQNALSQSVGQAVRIRFVLLSRATPSPSAAPPHQITAAAPSKAEQNAALQEAANNPFVQKIEEIFGAELHDISGVR